MLLMFLFSAIAFGAATVVRIETTIASRFGESAAARHAAEAALEVAVAELEAVPDWDLVVSGGLPSALSAGAFSGTKAVPGGGVVSVCCGPGSAMSRLVTDTRLSPLPARRLLEWRPFLWSTFDALAPHIPSSRLFVVVWVANDEDEAGQPSDANRTVLVRSEALEPGGVRRSLEALLTRRPSSFGAPATGRLLRWREIR